MSQTRVSYPEHIWWVKDSILPFFGQGKDLEIRVRNGFPTTVRVGDILFINRKIRRFVGARRSYPNFEAMLRKENPERIYPEGNCDSVLASLRKLYLPYQERKGVLVFELISI